MTKKNNYNYKYPQSDREIIAELSDPNYEGGSLALPENPTSLEVAKYKICQSIVAYALNKKFSLEKLAQQVQLSKAETKRMLNYRIDEFTLDRLIVYASKLGIEIQILPVRAFAPVRRTTSVRK